MPKGTVPEREVICRACSEPFRSTRAGKAAFYCRRPECDAARRARRFAVPNLAGPQRPTTVDSIARQVMTLQARQERERARFERQWRREVEAWIPRRARDEQRLARARARADAAAADLRALERAVGQVRAPIPTRVPAGRALTDLLAERHPFLSASNQAMAEHVIEHLDDVAFGTADQLAVAIGTSSSSVVRFSQAAGFDGYPDLQRAAQDEYRAQRTPGRPITLATTDGGGLAPAGLPESRDEEPRADVYDLLAHIRQRIIAPRDTAATRRDVQRAVVKLAHATGLHETHQALRNLAAEALSWDLALPGTLREGDIDTQAMRDAA